MESSINIIQIYLHGEKCNMQYAICNRIGSAVTTAQKSEEAKEDTLQSRAQPLS
jgi:hypothetical protein